MRPAVMATVRCHYCDKVETVETSRRTTGKQTGARSSRVVDAVLGAAVDELAQRGFSSFAVDSVARTAGVNRTTIYRRWPTKTALIAAVLEPVMSRYDHVPDSGSGRDDLYALLLTVRDNAATTEGLAFGAAIRADAEEMSDLLETVVRRALAPFHAVLRRTTEYGQLAQEDVDTIAHTAFMSVIMWRHTHGGDATDADCRRIARLLLGSAGADRRD
ncbi:TetR/AcrR family transcriptional regulator [Rhodococcus sp. SORGH_AS_0301]|uniref:TetR/AcrR family transcriptional regulator n=1 Tax=Rhodococcus sp. SORGH_AS_0301 TaxID=3041780 RepID=UPI0027845825|nr:TetR/AcrR family transcriptional regulator [Rhodococcus sp. SORGH_AS_0301]MDQ1178585.1 AcrR family transcriptional regulator [Rhodococcus sp. SORGH_AS_0301]